MLHSKNAPAEAFIMRLRIPSLSALVLLVTALAAAQAGNTSRPQADAAGFRRATAFALDRSGTVYLYDDRAERVMVYR